MPYGTVNADVIQTSTTGGILGAGNASIMKNRIINGAMVISQYNGTSSVTPTADGYGLDRWKYLMTNASKFSVQQNAGSVTPPAGFSNYLGITSLAATSLGATDYYLIGQFIEGFNTADLGFGTANAKTVTLSFQVYSSLTGTFGGVLQNSAINRSYPFTYSVPVANTWTTINITIAGDTSGTWVGATNGIGLRVYFSLGTGSTYSGTAGAWASGFYSSATGATSVVGTNGATFYITGVQLEVGSSATGYEYVNYQTNLANCQRYYYRTTAQTSGDRMGNGYIGSATGASVGFFYPVTMRTNPTALEQTGTATDYSVNWATSNTVCSAVPTFTTATTNFANVALTVASGLTTGQGCMARAATTSAYFGWSAEL